MYNYDFENNSSYRVIITLSENRDELAEANKAWQIVSLVAVL